MKLYLQRHAQPVLGHPMDGTRALTTEGQRQAKEMAAFMVRHIGRVDIVISSPFTRAVETAEVMADALGAHIVTTRMLEPDGKPTEMWAEIERIAQASQEVLIVGHDPSIQGLLLWMLDGAEAAAPQAKIRFEHGAIAHVRATGGGDGTLHWFVDMKIVERDVLEDVAEAATAFAAALAS